MTTYTIPPTSRYYGLPVLALNAGSDHPVPYLSRRFVPDSSQFSPLHTHPVAQGERMDLIAAKELGDPLAFWRICDANDALRPQDLTDPPGRVLAITLPLGVPGSPV